MVKSLKSIFGKIDVHVHILSKMTIDTKQLHTTSIIQYPIQELTGLNLNILIASFNIANFKAKP